MYKKAIDLARSRHFIHTPQQNANSSSMGPSKKVFADHCLCSPFTDHQCRELLEAYSNCQNGSDIISVQNAWLSNNSRIPEPPPDIDGVGTDAEHHGDGGRSDDDSEDGLPPLERNLNHLSLEVNEEESE